MQVVSDEAGAFRAWAVALQRRQLRYFLILLAISLATLFSLSTSSYPLSHFSSTARGASRGAPAPYHPTLVGPRSRFAAHGLSTSTSHPDFSQPKEVELRPIEWSFDLGDERGWVEEAAGEGASSCETPKVYSADEACELLGAFGGCVLSPLPLPSLEQRTDPLFAAGST